MTALELAKTFLTQAETHDCAPVDRPYQAALGMGWALVAIAETLTACTSEDPAVAEEPENPTEPEKPRPRFLGDNDPPAA